MSLACLDGEIAETASLSIPVDDDGFLRGDGVFEAVRLYAGRPFALDEHLQRMVRSAVNLRLELDVDALRADVRALLDAAQPGDAKLRIVVTRGGRRLTMLEPLGDLPPSMALACVEYAPTRLLDSIKSLSYAANMLATRIAQEEGADEALLTTPHGRLLEGPTSAFFAVLGDELVTAPLSDHVLDSITRRRILQVADVVERPIARGDIPDMAEAFLASSMKEVMPVHALDGRALPAPGPVTQDTAERLSAQIAAELGSPA